MASSYVLGVKTEYFIHICMIVKMKWNGTDWKVTKQNRTKQINTILKETNSK